MLEIGSIVGGKYRKYKILDKISHGGMYDVYLVFNEKENKGWIARTIDKDSDGKNAIKSHELILRAEELQNLHHENMQNIIEIIEENEMLVIIMDYIEGKPLASVLKHQGAQPEANVVEWSKQLCDVLGYLHTREKPMIYNQLSLSNIVLGPDGNIKLLDVWNAVVMKIQTNSENAIWTDSLGIAQNVAPEQFGDFGHVDERTDIYCLGVVMHQLLTGNDPTKPPYEMYPIRYYRTDLSSSLERVILKCTQFDRKDRYQSCKKLKHILEIYNSYDS